MSNSGDVYLKDTQALSQFSNALARFADRVQSAIIQTEAEIRRTQEWLQERVNHWQRQVMLAHQEDQAAQYALRHCQNSVDYDRDGRRIPPDCSAEMAYLSVCRRKLQQAETELHNVKRWQAKIEQVINQYQHSSKTMKDVVTTNIKRGQNTLTQKVATVAKYDKTTFSSSGSSATTLDKSAFLQFGELAANTTYKRSGYEYQTDDGGRVKFVYGKLRIEKGKRTSHQQEVGHSGLETDEGGHWIGSRFDGSPQGVNLFQQDANFNKGVYKRLENKWADAVKAGKNVEVAIQPVYLGGSERPIGVDIYYVINGQATTVVFYNEAKGGLI